MGKNSENHILWCAKKSRRKDTDSLMIDRTGIRIIFYSDFGMHVYQTILLNADKVTVLIASCILMALLQRNIACQSIGLLTWILTK